MEIRKDCYAYNTYKNKCRALNDLYCQKEKCRFYKSNTELNWEDIEDELRKYRREN